MARLDFSIGHFELNLCDLERSGSPKWYSVEIELCLNWHDQTTSIKNTKRVSLTSYDVSRLVEQLRLFLSRLAERGNDTLRPLDPPIETYYPLELSFLVRFLDGEVEDDLAGNVNLGIFVNLDVLDYSLGSNYVGADVEVEVAEITAFCNNLEDELSKMKHPM